MFGALPFGAAAFGQGPHTTSTEIEVVFLNRAIAHSRQTVDIRDHTEPIEVEPVTVTLRRGSSKTVRLRSDL